ncbi:hypothetical protein [Desertibaculum subflavum]|uniref:hypothetical protein n=1 Tax=Desertibaculum subflavum TaxID=2268458 RepID=UPI000E660116
MSDPRSTSEIELPSGARLLRSTLFAMVAAALILVVIVLPSEYGIRPTEVPQLYGIGQPKSAETVATMSVDLGAGRRRDEFTIRLAPDQSAEVKLAMRAGAKVAFTWSAEGGGVNFNAHGDPEPPAQGGSHRYGSGQQAERDAGTIEAAFDGLHGWYWKNRTDRSVTVTLQTEGEYRELKRML